MQRARGCLLARSVWPGWQEAARGRDGLSLKVSLEQWSQSERKDRTTCALVGGGGVVVILFAIDEFDRVELLYKNISMVDYLSKTF